MKKTTRQSGFTITEILITIFVIGVGMIAILSMFVLSNAIVGRSHRTNQAYLIANQTIEQLRAAPFSSLNDDTTTQSVSELPSGQLTKTISSYESDIHLKQVNIAVSWQEKGKTITVNIISLATPRGINN